MPTYGLVKTVCIGSIYMAKSKACTCRTQSLVCLSVCMVFGILFIYFALDMVDCNTDTKKIWEKGKNKKLDFQSSWHWSQPTLSLSLSLSLSLWFLSSISTPAKLIRAGLGTSILVSIHWHWCWPIVLLLSHWRSHHFLLLCIIQKQAAY